MLLLKGINKVLGKYRGGSHCQVSYGNVMKEVTSELALEEDKQKFSRRENLTWQQAWHLASNI